MAIVIELDANQNPIISTYATSTRFKASQIPAECLAACDPMQINIPSTQEIILDNGPLASPQTKSLEKIMPIYTQSSEKKYHSKNNLQPLNYMYNLYSLNIISDENYEPWFEKTVSIYASNKYKPVALRTKPVLATLPDKFRIIHNIKGDPLKDLPELLPHPPKFISTT